MTNYDYANITTATLYSSDYVEGTLDMTGYVEFYADEDKPLYLHPVLNLKADTLFKGGSGTANDPYIISLD